MDNFQPYFPSQFILLRFASSICNYIQKILKWCQNGSNHPRFDEQEILTLKLPHQLLRIEADIVRLITQGIEAHRSAGKLLEDAKRQVERMILGETPDAQASGK
jgi:hypothetical protein